MHWPRRSWFAEAGSAKSKLDLLAAKSTGIPPRGAPSPRVNPRTIYFDPGRATLKPTSKKALREVVGTLRADPTSTVRLEGHTDAIGAERNNKTLARARANTVAIYLKRQGIGGGRIHAVGMGEAGPVADNDTEKGRAKNGRVDIRVDTRTAFVH